jgi:hypothetical protein
MNVSLKYNVIISEKVVCAATGTLRVDSEIGDIVVPFKLKAFKSNMKWEVEACQPMFQNKADKWKESWLSIHLSAAAKTGFAKALSVKFVQELARESHINGESVMRTKIGKEWVKDNAIVDEFSAMVMTEIKEGSSSVPATNNMSAEDAASSILNS